MKTIIHITTFLQGGAGKVICDLIESQKHDHVNIVCISNKTSYSGYLNYPEYEKKLKRLGVKHIKIEGLFKRKPLEIYKSIKKVTFYLNTSNVTLIHAHSAIPALIAFKAREQSKKKFPIIQTVHGWGNNKTFLQTRQDIKILSDINLIISVSKSTKSLLVKKGIYAYKIKNIYNGIDLEDNRKKQPGTFFDKLSEKSVLIGCIGSICERKNQKVIIDTFFQIKNKQEKFLPLYCVFIGEDDTQYASFLKKQVKLSGLSENIKFTGCIDNARQYIDSFSCTILASHSEGLPLSIIESFKAKTIVIASNIQEIKELIIHKKTGFLFNPDSPNSLESVLMEFLAMPDGKKNKIINAAFNSFKNNFTNYNMNQAYKRTYTIQLCKN